MLRQTPTSSSSTTTGVRLKDGHSAEVVKSAAAVAAARPAADASADRVCGTGSDGTKPELLSAESVRRDDSEMALPSAAQEAQPDEPKRAKGPKYRVMPGGSRPAK